MAPRLRDQERYDILGEHGRGGLGRVARAYDRELGRDIAIKELISRGHVSEVRFLREALITARLEHPGIVPVYEAGRWADGTPFYAMKLVSGRPLRDLVDERKTIDERIGLLHHVIAVADAMAYAHGRGIIHRDLKPANVIVGEFGETVVIDWGLAKDLSDDQEPAFADGPFRGHTDDGLTAIGKVLGTPAYMAPEQARGEAVDQRADVFAIGAMLWELCSLDKLATRASQQRPGIRRAAVIDPDLIAIVEKALATDPALRYPDAGALAADLKAFKAGARIAARRYSPAAVLAHWARRNRRLAWLLASLIALALATALLYIRGIAVERDRADDSEADARRARAITDRSLSVLTLKHAELLLQSDPTAALAALAGYHGSDATRRDQLVAEAHGRGVAREILQPHNDTVHFVIGQPDGSIVSLGEDHRLRRTRGAAITTLASNVSDVVRVSYAPGGRLLAYATSPRGIALLDLQTSVVRRIDTDSPAALALAPDGSQLAVLDKAGALTVWDTTTTTTASQCFHRAVPAADSVAFVADHRVALLGKSRLSIVDTARTAPAAPGDPPSLAVTATAIHASGAEIAVGTREGDVLLVALDLTIRARLHGCKDHVSALALIPRSDRLLFACQEGGVGIARHRSASGELVRIGGFRTQPDPFLLAVDELGEYVATSADRDAYLHHVSRGVTAVLRGQAAYISAIAAPTRQFPHLVTGDVSGAVRVWELEEPHARVLAHVQGRPFGAVLAPDGATLAVFGDYPDVHLVGMADGAITELHGHKDAIRGVRFSPDGERVLSYSWDDTARIWQTHSAAPLRVLDAHRALIQDGGFLRGGREVATAGDDGHVFLWSTDDRDPIAAFAHTSPLLLAQPLPGTDELVTVDSAGSMWVVRPDGAARRVRTPDRFALTNVTASRDRRLLAVGQESGDLTIYRTTDWTVAQAFTLDGTIGRIEFDPQNRDLLVSAGNGSVHLLPLDARRTAPWRSMQVRAHDMRYAPDGELIAITTREGGTWFYSMPRRSWRYVHDHPSELAAGRFSPDGATFVSVDQDGTIVARDIRGTLSQPMAATHP
jgi:WD40 repeat protein